MKSGGVALVRGNEVEVEEAAGGVRVVSKGDREGADGMDAV